MAHLDAVVRNTRRALTQLANAPLPAAAEPTMAGPQEVADN